MKYLTLFLFFAFVGKIASAPPTNPFSPKYSYRIDREQPVVVTDESSEDGQSDETDVETEDPSSEIEELQQQDEASEEDEEPPPEFSKLFPAPSGAQGRPSGQGNLGRVWQSAKDTFSTMMKEIDENGWKAPKENRINNDRERSGLRQFRDDDDDDSDEDEDEDEEDELADDIAPDMDLMFPNSEGKASGPQNVPEPTAFGDLTSNAISVGDVDSLKFRSLPWGRGRSQQGPVYVSRAPSSNMRYGQGNRMPSRAVAPMVVSYVQGPYYYGQGGNRRVMSEQMSYNHNRQMQPMSYNHNRQMQHQRQRPMYQYQMPMQMSYRPSGQMYVDGYGRQQYYVQSPVRRTYVPMAYMRQQMQMRQRQPMQQYYTPSRNSMTMRNRRNGRFWRY